ncbi:MAG: Major facilitator protein [Thermoleophilia bacterium]|nr:Major facilitator protein [Thermoleophilia bacterium]
MFGAQLISSIGSQVTLVALFFQVYDLTHSTLKVGLLGLVMVVPTLCLALLGGAIADSMDRRRLLVMVQVAMATVSLTLTWLATHESPPLWALYVLAAAASSFAAIDGPTRTAVMPMLVDAATLRSAVQLREVLTQSGRTFGPIIGGVLIAQVSLPAAYLLDTASFVIAFLLFLGLPSLVPETRRRFELSSITEGLHFVAQRPILAATFWADLFAMVLGQQRALFPAYAATAFGGGAMTFGFLVASPSAGAMVGLLFMGLFRNVQREGLAVLVAVAAWGAFIALFSLSPWLWLAMLFLACAGAADMVSAIFRQTILLATVPDELRGRMGAVHIMVVTGGPPIGDMVSGSAGEAFGIRVSSLVGGVGVIAGMVLLAWRVPGFARWRDPARVEPSRDGTADDSTTASP